MSTGNGYDLRRTDLRSNVLENPYWITSGEMVAATINTYDAVLFSFPITEINSPGYGNTTIIIHDVLFEVVVAITGGSPVCTTGLGTLVSDVCGSPGSGDVTDVTADLFHATGDITFGTPGVYGVATDGGWLGEAAANTYGNRVRTIAPHDTTVVAVVAYMSGTPTAGTARLHMLISEVPAVR